MRLGDCLQGVFLVRSYFWSGQADQLPKGREKGMSTELLVPSDNSNHFQCRSVLLAEKSLFSYTDTDVLLEMSWDRIKTNVLGAGT